MSNKEQEPLNAPLGTTIDELDHRHIVESATPKGLLYIAVGSLTLAVIVAFIFNNHIENKRAAAEAMGSAATAEELQAVADEHAGSVSAGTALIELSNQQIAEGRFEEGVATLDTFLKDYSKHPLVDRALLAKASAQMRLDRNDDAIATLDQFAAKHNDSPFSDLATILRGDVEKERGNKEAALAAYTIAASSEAAGGSLAQLARERQKFVNYTSPREVEPAPMPEPELPVNGNLPAAPTGDPEIDAMINQVMQQNQAATPETTLPATEEAESESSETPPADPEATNETPQAPAQPIESTESNEPAESTDTPEA